MAISAVTRTGLLACGVAAVAALVWATTAGSGSSAPEAPWASTEAASQYLDEAPLWMAPEAEPAAPAPLARAVLLLYGERAEEALPLFSAQLADPLVGPYARLYVGRAQLMLERHADAVASARRVIETAPAGHLGEAALWLLGDAHEAAGDWGTALETWQTLAGLPLTTPARAHLRLAKAAEKAGKPAIAREAFSRIHFEWPTSVEALEASTALSRPGMPSSPDLAKREQDRAEKLFVGRRYDDARKAFEALRVRAAVAAKPALALRVAQCDVHLRRFAAGLAGLDAYLAAGGPAREEAGAYRLTALRGLARGAEYVRGVAAFVAAHPASAQAESALNDLATYYILADEDETAAGVFADMYRRFPKGVYADRAAWRAGWWAYRKRDYRTAITFFESAAAAIPRADYRPSWLYWAGRAHQQLGERDLALAGYRQTVSDYRNSYYGRQASRAIEEIPGGIKAAAAIAVERDPVRNIAGGRMPANASTIRKLLAVGLYEDAILELRHAQSAAGTSPAIEATIAYALNRKGDLRAGITAMRRAYPGFMAEGGERLPMRLRRIIFPIDHWDLIRRYASERGIDPFLMTALVAQESTFQADVRSAADAWGLMQLLPSTGRRYATKLGVRPFSTARLTDPEVNVRLGSAYLADLLAQFGDPASALAAYNAGENRITRWRAERPGVPRDEFIDDIPFPETQNYVKRILGTAEDYRSIYGSSLMASAPR